MIKWERDYFGLPTLMLKKIVIQGTSMGDFQGLIGAGQPLEGFVLVWDRAEPIISCIILHPLPGSLFSNFDALKGIMHLLGIHIAGREGEGVDEVVCMYALKKLTRFFIWVLRAR